MTYGWAILAAMIVIGVLALLGVFSPQAPSQAILSPPFYAKSWEMGGILLMGGASGTESAIKIEVENKGNNDVELIESKIKGTIVGDEIICEDTDKHTLQIDESTIIEAVCDKLLTPGERFKGNVVIKYTKIGETFVMIVRGTISGVVKDVIISIGGDGGSCTPEEEICDGIDNDCDSEIDEELVPGLCPLQQGVCEGSVTVCGGEDGWLDCTAGNYGVLYEETEVTCDDNNDNDCDGNTDSSDSDCGDYLSASVEITDITQSPLNRCVTFNITNCNTKVSEVLNQVVAFTNGEGNALIQVTDGQGYTCVTARDKLHTLQQRQTSLTKVDNQYLADFTGTNTLISGNLNDDKWIDILDFGVFSSEYGKDYGTGDTTCTTPNPNADLNGDGIVTPDDQTIIQSHFMQGSESNCCT